MDMNVPVYLFTGLLDSGKTMFIQDTCKDPNFHEGEHTLLIVCEEGDNPYDEVVMKEYDCDIVYVKEEQTLSAQFLETLEQTYHPDRVIIEFNGMWNVTSFMDIEFPIRWLLVQILSTVDAATFQLYLNNMRTIMYDQLAHSEVIIFNRCDDSTKKSFLRGNVKVMNKSAQLIYESKDGAINQLQDDELPFDVTSQEINIKEEDFGLWYMDVMERPSFYDGKIVTFCGQVIEVNMASGKEFLIGRDAMVCCAEDIQPIGFLVQDPKASVRIQGEWLELQAEMKCVYEESYGGDVAVLYAKQMHETKPITDLVTFS